jgi:hypothetical protein
MYKPVQPEELMVSTTPFVAPSRAIADITAILDRSGCRFVARECRGPTLALHTKEFRRLSDKSELKESTL